MREGGPVVLGAVVTVVTVVGRLLGPMIGAGLVEALLSDLGVRVRGLRPVSELCKFSVERGLLRSRPLGSLARRCPAVWKTQQLESGVRTRVFTGCLMYIYRYTRLSESFRLSFEGQDWIVSCKSTKLCRKYTDPKFKALPATA